ncbi:MAG: hypothetical protein KAG53_06290 [Endozoicomonadaceae bacterium]|nr:hypothetical protein [Endozoicomonadaceae bacterium]
MRCLTATLKRFRNEVKALTVQAETADQAPVNEGMNIPEEIARCKERLKGLAAAKDLA